MRQQTGARLARASRSRRRGRGRTPRSRGVGLARKGRQESSLRLGLIDGSDLGRQRTVTFDRCSRLMAIAN
jgi:hypothetical protein